VPTTARAAAVLAAENFEHLAGIAGEITTSADRGDIISYLDADRRFHLELIATVGNQRLTDLVDRLRRQTRLFGLHNLARTGRLVASADEHHQLLAALKAGDTGAVTHLMNAHIAHTRGVWAGRDEDL
jgi:DNA-binding GntR family transcriptional regulator